MIAVIGTLETVREGDQWSAYLRCHDGEMLLVASVAAGVIDDRQDRIGQFQAFAKAMVDQFADAALEDRR